MQGIPNGRTEPVKLNLGLCERIESYHSQNPSMQKDSPSTLYRQPACCYGPNKVFDNLLRSFLAIWLVLILASCLTTGIRQWPSELPEQSLFIRTYRADIQNQLVQSQKTYLEWVVGFYQGTLIHPTGWLDVEARLFRNADPLVSTSLAERVEALGILIGAEWAKANEIRIIDNRMLALWGSTLQLMQSPDEQLAAIDIILSDINELFDGRLYAEDITEARYADRLGFEVFGEF